MEYKLPVQRWKGFHRTVFMAGTQAQIYKDGLACCKLFGDCIKLTTARSISTAAQIHNGYVPHDSSYVEIKDCQMKTVRRTPAIVTMMPADSRTTTPIRSRRGMCRRMMIGIGRIVHSKSATQLMTPAAMVMTPSSKQWPSTTSGKVQYFRTGLDENR